MDQLIRQLFLNPAPGVSAGDFSQLTLGQLIQTLENIAAERRKPFRVIHCWNRRHFPDLPVLPVNRHLPTANYQDLSAQLSADTSSMLYLYDDGRDCFSLAGTLSDSPDISVFERKISVQAFWSFERDVQQQLLEEAGRFSSLMPAPVNTELIPTNLDGSFHGQLLGFLEESLLESGQTLHLITGILKVQKTIVRELDFERLLELIGSTLIETFRFELGELSLWNEETQALEHQVTWNAAREEQHLNQNLLILLDQELEREFFDNGQPVVLDRLIKHSVILNHKLIEILGLRFAIFLPLIAGEDRIGMLKMYYTRSELISPARLAWLDELSQLLADAILNAREHTRAFELATKDSLTNLHNRRYFEEQFYLELERSKRTGSSLCLLMLDVDHFKQYNDRNGHLMGDDVLIRVARLVKGCIRAVDFLARYGGEEFIILLTGANGDVGRLVGEKIRSRVEEEDFVNEENQPGGQLTVSIGVAEMERDTKQLEQLIRAADRALYYAKENGRNLVVSLRDGRFVAHEHASHDADSTQG